MMRDQTDGRPARRDAPLVIGIVCALASEARHLGVARGPGPQPTALGQGSLLAISGMGAARATGAARELVAAGAGALMSWGMAGGLDPQLEPGTIILPRQVRDSQGRLIQTSQCWRDRLASALAGRPLALGGTLLSVDSVLASSAAKAHCFRSTQAQAVDMESFAIGQVASCGTLPFIAVRVIVDAARDALPSLVLEAIEGRTRPDRWQLAGSVLRHPAQIGALLRLAQRHRAASRSLAAIVRSSALRPAADRVEAHRT